MTVNTLFDPSSFLKQLTSSPGIYQMLDKAGEIIYVGKAKNLKKRVSSYFLKKHEHSKTTHMVSKIYDINIVVTQTEVEALLLESNLIKKYKPRYNILLRDDKSYPYIRLEKHHDYPHLSIYRGIPNSKFSLFGPFPNATAVKETLEFLNKLFKLRSCSNSFFKHRSRPCLQYQIKRCTAPCVGYITKDLYSDNLAMATAFLNGHSDQLLRDIESRMSKASEQLDFEKAVIYRDQLQSLRAIQVRQRVSNKGGDADVLAVMFRENISCVVLLKIRNGQVIGSYKFFPKLSKLDRDSDKQTILEAFISQYYLHNPAVVPKEIIANSDISTLLLETLCQIAQQKCIFLYAPRGLKSKWLDLAMENAEHALNTKLLSKNNVRARYLALAELLLLDSVPKHMECFDISHTGGELTVASCVVFDGNGPKKSAYRKFNINGITGGDDYAAMEQVLTRRYKRLINESQAMPDLLVIDGGRGQVNIAQKVMEKLNLEKLKIIGVAKGEGRKPGLETIIVAFDGREVTLDADDPALHLIQHIRDESHRFAITSHRKKREAKTMTSVLEDIEGIGAKRRQALLKRFGGLQNLKTASVDEIMQVPGINKALALMIHQYFKQ